MRGCQRRQARSVQSCPTTVCHGKGTLSHWRVVIRALSLANRCPTKSPRVVSYNLLEDAVVTQTVRNWSNSTYGLTRHEHCSDADLEVNNAAYDTHSYSVVLQYVEHNVVHTPRRVTCSHHRPALPPRLHPLRPRHLPLQRAAQRECL